MLYQGSIKNKTIYVYATLGTQDLKDLTEDGKQLVGTAKQYEESAEYAKELAEKYVNLYFTGHSLGGGLASVNSLVTGKQAVTFNPAPLSLATKRALKIDPNVVGNIRAYHIDGEAVSFYSSIIGMKVQGKEIVLPGPLIYIPVIDDTTLFLNTLQRLYMHRMEAVKQALKN